MVGSLPHAGVHGAGILIVIARVSPMRARSGDAFVRAVAAIAVVARGVVRDSLLWFADLLELVAHRRRTGIAIQVRTGGERRIACEGACAALAVQGLAETEQGLRTSVAFVGGQPRAFFAVFVAGHFPAAVGEVIARSLARLALTEETVFETVAERAFVAGSAVLERRVGAGEIGAALVERAWVPVVALRVRGTAFARCPRPRAAGAGRKRAALGRAVGALVAARLSSEQVRSAEPGVAVMMARTQGVVVVSVGRARLSARGGGLETGVGSAVVRIIAAPALVAADIRLWIAA